MTGISRVPISAVFLALTSAASVLGCHASSHNSLSGIRPYAQLIEGSNAYDSKETKEVNTKPILRHVNLHIRGGAEADRYEYDDRPRRSPVPPGGERGGRAMRNDAFYRNEREKRPRDYDGRMQYDSRYDGERRNRRDDDRWVSDREDRRAPLRQENDKRSRAEPPVAKKKKSWFSSKNQEKTEEEQRKQQQPPPPPPPPSTFADYNPAETDRVPINYMFPSAEVAASERTHDEKINDFDPMGGPDLPIEDVRDQFVNSEAIRERRRRRSDDDDRYASPRRDAVTMYMSTRVGAVKVRLGSIVVGAALGSFIGKVRASMNVLLQENLMPTMRFC